jgi:hypothetical protein
MNGRLETDGGGLVGPLRIAVWGGAALLMLAPAVATRLSDEVQWDPGDFILAGAMLLAGCGLFELVVRKTDSWSYRAGAMIAAGAAFLTFLTAGAVGIIGGEDGPANLLYLGVSALAAAGALAARFRPRGMALAMAAAAAANVLAGVAGLSLVADLRGFALGTALFTPLWLASAWLFAKAGRQQSS